MVSSVTQTSRELITVGKPVPRIDAVERVTGRGQYVFDMELPRMLYGKVKRSSLPHAEIIRIDKSKAERLPGVYAVLTAEDVPAGLRGRGLMDTPILARGRVRYVGEPVAVVAAETKELAEEAIELIDVEYRELPALYDPEESARSNPSVIIHPDLPNYKRLSSQIYRTRYDPNHPNVTHSMKIRKGNVEESFNEADLIIENKFRTHMFHHLHMEPVVAIAKQETDGTLTIWTSGQQAFRARKEMSDGLMIPQSKIHIIIPPFVGGGFGNKGTTNVEALCAVLAMKTQRPTKIAFTREENFATTTVRHPSVITIKDGVKKDGTIIAREMTAIYNGGAYSIAGNIVVRDCIYAVASVYKISNFKLDVCRVYTNQVQGGAFRGFGTAQAFWAIETQMDIVAARLGMNPVELRQKNILREGDRNVIGEAVKHITLDQCIDKAVAAIEWGKRRQAEGVWRHGKGIAIAQEMCDVSFASAASVKYKEDDTIEVWTVAADPGEGIRTVLAQIAAEEMEVPLEKVVIMMADTSLSPIGTGASGSRQTSQMGKAVLLACREVKQEIAKVASEKLRTLTDKLEVKGTKIVYKYTGEVAMNISELYLPGPMGGAYVPGIGEFTGKAAWHPETGELDNETGQCTKDMAVAYYTPVAQAVDLSVNVETGHVRINKFVGAIDVGKAINPLNVTGQNEGGISMGISTTLYEQLIVEDGKIVNPDLKDYKFASSMEYVPIQSIILENAHEEGPFGAKGCGEASITATAPAIGNAIYDAIGIRFTDLPLTAEKILLAIKEKRDSL